MTTAIGASAAIDSALRRSFSEASVRVAPETRISDVVEALATMGVSTSIEDGLLVLAQGSTEMNNSRALRSFAARPEHAKFFVVEGAHPSTWSQAKKIEFLRSHSDDEFGKLFASPVLEAGVKTLDANMDRASFKGLTVAEKVAFVREFSDAGVQRVMRKPA